MVEINKRRVINRLCEVGFGPGFAAVAVSMVGERTGLLSERIIDPTIKAGVAAVLVFGGARIASEVAHTVGRRGDVRVLRRLKR